MAMTVVGMCFTWPILEALVSEGETRAGLQQMIGIYNVIWAATGAVAYFTGGAMLEKLGRRSLFYVPAAIQLIQLLLTFWLESQAARRARASEPAGLTKPMAEVPESSAPHAGGGEPVAARTGTATLLAPPALAVGAQPPPRARTECFLRMAWLANPFAYVAINTLIAGIPGVARRLELSTMLAGFCCSVWCFARLGAFLGLWLWPGWHYRFRWLLLAYVALVGAFAAILMAPNLAVLVLAQMFLGGALGLIYYSSLFYSMDLSETKSEHGGIHEAVIGLGNFAGPAVGAASLLLLPQYANSGTLAVSGLLLLGLGGLTGLWWRGNRRSGGVALNQK
jgi:hypothetical protein